MLIDGIAARPRLVRTAVAVAAIVSLVAPQAHAQEVPHGTIAYATSKVVRTTSADGSGDTLRFKKKGWTVCCPIVSPDGLHVVFTAIHKKSGNSAVMVVDLASGDVRTIAGKRFNAGNPSWSNDGSHVAFSAYSKEKKGVYVASVNASGKTKIYDKKWAFDTPSWSHDDSKVAFSDLKGLKARVWYYDFNTTELYRLPSDFSLDAYAPEWSPTEDVLLFRSFQETEDGGLSALYTVDAMGQTLTMLSVEGEDVVRAFWAPDGSVIAFDSCCEGGERSSVVQIAPDGSGRTELAGDNDAEGVHSFLELYGYSPDGASIAYGTWDYDDADELLDGRLWTMNADGSGSIDRLADPESFFLGWAPDSEAILLCSSDFEGGNQALRYLLGDAVFDIGPATCDAHWGP